MEIGLFLYRQINEQLNYTDRHFDVFSFATFKSSEIMTINTKKVISIRGLMPWPKKTGAGLPDKGSAINGWLSLGVWLGSMIYGDGSKRKVRSLVPCCGQDGYRAQVPQHPIDSNNI